MTNSILKSAFNIKLFDFDTKLPTPLNSSVFEAPSVETLNIKPHKNVLEDFSIPKSLDAVLSLSNIINTNLSDYSTLKRITNGIDIDAYNPTFPSISTYSTTSRINPTVDEMVRNTLRGVDPEYPSRNIDLPKYDNTLPGTKTNPRSAFSDDGFDSHIKLAGNEYPDANTDIKLTYKAALKAAMREHWSDFEEDLERENDHEYPFTPPSLPKLANTGSSNDDTFINLSFKQNFDGKEGIDNIVYAANKAEYSITKSGNGFSVSNLSNSFSYLLRETDHLINIERIEFNDTKVALDINGNAGEVAKILGAVLGKESIFDKELVGIGIESLDKGASLEDFSLETITTTGNSSFDEVVSLLWSNVIGTNPTPEQARPFIDILERGEKSTAELAIYASETSQNQDNINLVGLQSTGIEYIEFINS